MKHSPLFFLFLTFNVLSAQRDTLPPLPDDVFQELIAAESPSIPDKTFEIFDIEKLPSFPGGESELMRFLGNNIVYPDSAKYYGITGRVVATFVVNKDGFISDIMIKRDIGRDCGKEG